MKSMYELNEEYSALQAALEQGVETPEEEAALQEALNATADNIEEKADMYAKIIRNLQGNVDTFKAEEQRLSNSRKKIENSIERLKRTIYNTMTLLGAKKINCSIGSWNIQKNQPSVTIVDPSKIPERFLIPQKPTIDKRAMLAEYKETGEVFDGVEIDRKESLRFR